MTYAKPEAVVLGFAEDVIQLNNVPKQTGGPDHTGQPIAPAYDLDE